MTIGLRSELNAEGWAAWVQAIGSVVAIVGAVWISNADQRSRRRDAVATAELMAIRVERSLVHALAALEVPTTRFRAEGPFGIQRGWVDAVVQNLETVKIPTQSDLQLLWPLPQQLAAKAVKALYSFEVASIAFRMEGLELTSDDLMDRIVPFEHLCTTLVDTSNTLIDVLNAFEIYLGEGCLTMDGTISPLDPIFPRELSV